MKNRSFWLFTVFTLLVLLIVPREWELQCPGYTAYVVVLGLVWSAAFGLNRGRR